MRQTIIPEWFKGLPNDACINAVEVKEIFGFEPKAPTTPLVKNGSIPAPDGSTKGLGYKPNPKPRWSAGTVRKLLEGN